MFANSALSVQLCKSIHNTTTCMRARFLYSRVFYHNFVNFSSFLLAVRSVPLGSFLLLTCLVYICYSVRWEKGTCYSVLRSVVVTAVCTTGEHLSYSKCTFIVCNKGPSEGKSSYEKNDSRVPWIDG